jgi:hypothetical protein
MKDFLYIKPQKTGTKSIRLSLSKYTDNVQGIKITNENSNICEHKTFLQYKEIFNNGITGNTVLIMSIRNPFDRMISWYFDTIKRRFREFDYKSLSFADAIKNRPEWVNRLIPLSEFNKGTTNINYIRFENLQQDFDIVCDKIGIARQQLPHENKTKHKHYTEYYDDETCEIVAEKYAKDIEYFRYKFGE